MNANKSMVMIFERSRSEVVNTDCLYRVKVEYSKVRNITLNGERMKEKNEFKYLGLLACKHGRLEGKAKERAVHGRKVIGSLQYMMKVRTVDMKVKGTM